MSDIQAFNFNGLELRAMERDGEPWFVASDVARALEFRDASNFARTLDDEDRGTHKVSTPGGTQNVIIVSESGLYSAMIRSNSERAKPFRKWVTAEVLPTIRKHGAYATENTLENLLQDPDNFIHLLQNLKQEKEQRALAEAKALELEPKAQVYDEFMSADGSLSVGDAAKLLAQSGIVTGPNRLFKTLDSLKWTYIKGRDRHIMETARAQGLLIPKAQSYIDQETGERVAATPQIRITPKGIERLRIKLLPPLLPATNSEVAA